MSVFACHRSPAVPSPDSGGYRPSRSPLCLAVALALGSAGMLTAHAASPTDNPSAGVDSVPSLDGSGNNPLKPEQGMANTAYRRVAEPRYADGQARMIDAPNARYISNRVFADSAQNLFSENGVTQWAYNWGQFVDHSIGLRTSSEEPMHMAFDADDPLESFTNETNVLHATRSGLDSAAKPGTAREQVNTVSSYIDAWAVYGGTEDRLEWLREGPVDGDLSNNSARLLLTDSGHLPTASERGDPASAPPMERQGQLLGARDADQQQIVAGDLRANENIALTTVQTLFAREHNRVVDRLPADWTEQRKFDVARLLVIATQQHITYEEFLPVIGVELAEASDYQPDIDASLSNAFATVGYRAHSTIHGEIEAAVDVGYYSDATIDYLKSKGIEFAEEDGELELAVPLNVAFGNPQLVTDIGVGTIALGLAMEPQYKNDEQIDNQLRSVLFQMPKPGMKAAGVEDPDACLDGPTMNECFGLVHDLGALDIMRGRDHGMPAYNDLREAYGLPRVESFTELTGESTEEFPTDDPLIDTEAPIDDPDIMAYVELRDADGELIELESEEAEGDAISGVRRTTLAARLKAIYGSVDQVEAFVGMVSEEHMAGSEFGPLQHAMWKDEFETLRDGDANHYLWNDHLRRLQPMLDELGLTWRQSLADVVINNTSLDADSVRPELFKVEEDVETDSLSLAPSGDAPNDTDDAVSEL